MPMFEKYRDYFAIDPEYFPAVNEKVIKDNPEMWKKFYPHETFIKLLKNTVDVLERRQKLCLWVEGAYGTGKSHAVLTLKKLLDANASDTQGYFEEYRLDKDLLNRFQSVKESGKILTVHRYGSATITSDFNLAFAVQESIENALKDAGIENRGENALKKGVLEWLSDKHNRGFFNGLIMDEYSDEFGGDDVDAVERKLNTLTGDELSTLMNKIFMVANADNHKIVALTLSTSALAEWIREVIRANGLKAIVFIWDEFSEYFRNNTHGLTGFQEICEISETDPFYFILVTHETQGMFYERDQDFIKLNGRFVSPHCIISLPDNIAFQLMGTAMKVNQDAEVKSDWEMTRDDLVDRTRESRKLVQSVAGISDQEMQAILPIHPYAALLLKHISSAFDSNQRSMFDFIKNDRGDEIKGFQWFMDNCGPLDDNPLLTVDMLWDFFYEKGKEYLAHEIRSVLDYYYRTGNSKLDSDQKKVLKTVLLLQAISMRAGDSVELFVPNEKNLCNAFEGTDIGDGASRIADQLVRDKVLFSKSLGGGKSHYAAYSNEVDVDVKPFEERIDAKSTTALVTEELSDKTRVVDVMALEGALKLRYELRFASSSDFDSTIGQLRNTEERFENKIVAVACFAKDENEGHLIGKKINAALKDGSYHMVFIDASGTTLGIDGYKNYRHDMALSMSQQGKDKALADQYKNNAQDSLKKWKSRIETGEFTVYTVDRPEGNHVVGIDLLCSELMEIDKRKFPECLEGHYNVIANMYTPSNLKQGVESACEQKTRGTFLSASPATKLENALEGAWKVDRYWESRPSLHISKIKAFVDEIIGEAFEKNGRISIRDIYDALKAAPYGFMPCNLSAFMLGFVLKEYTDGSYSCSDDITSNVLDVNKLKEIIDEVIKLDITPSSRYRDKYIVATTSEEKAFNEISSVAFDIPINSCSSVQNTRERIRDKMKGFSFPIWTLKSILGAGDLKTDRNVLEKFIDRFVGIANSNNMDGNESESDNAMAIGKLYLENPEAASDLRSLLNKEKCREGMIAYLKTFDEGELVALADEVEDGGQYINAVKKKFDANDANWLWNVATVDQKIQEVILEYKIIAESNKVIPKSNSYDAAISGWLDRCRYIRISYDAGSTSFEDLRPFMEMLCKLKKAGALLDSQKKDFLDLLVAHGSAFRDFYGNQVAVFKKVCAYDLADLSDEDIQEIYGGMPADSFTSDKSTYLTTVENRVNTYKNSLKSTQLKKMWKERTHSDTPRRWSKDHRMPILCLIPDQEMEQARAAFGAVNREKPDAASVEKAMAYFENASFFDVLDDEAALDRAFRERIIKNYDVMLTDINAVKEHLSNHVASEAYDWLGVKGVDDCLRAMAENEYNKGGYNRALEKLENLPADRAKEYLETLIKNNMTVGMEIIKENR